MMEQILEILKKNVKQAAVEIVAEVVGPALEEAAKKSPTPIDDVLVAALKEPLKAELLKIIEKI